LALACHSYHDLFASLPRNGDQTALKQSHNDLVFLGPGTGCCGVDGRHWSWIARLLPQLEQDALYRQGNIPNNKMNKDRTTLAVLATDLKVLTCPSDLSSRSRTNAGDLEGILAAVTNYKGVSGSNWGTDHYSTVCDCEGRLDTNYRNRGSTNSYNGLENGDGIFWRAEIRKGNLGLESTRDRE